jgi:hypothetical protein
MNLLHAPRVVAALLLLVAPALCDAQWWNPQSTIPPGKLGMPGYTIQYDRRLQDQAVEAIVEAFHARDFAKLDRMHAEFLEMHRTGAPGSSLLEAFSTALTPVFMGGDRAAYQGFFDAWREAAPDSQLRPVAEGMSWWQQAWDARGHGFGSEVPPEAMRAFEADLGRAMQVLRDGEQAGRATPLWYWAVVSVAGSMGTGRAVMDRVFEEGATRLRLFMPLYDSRLNFLLPQWGGDFAAVDRFVRAAVLRTQATQGTTLYADLYAIVLERFIGNDFFRETRASWKLLQHAYEEQVARGKVDLNRYAAFACIARDRETTADLLSRLGDKANLGEGLDSFSTEACAELAKEGR